MWIFFGIVAFLVVLIVFVLLLPVYIIIKNDKNNKLIFKVKVLFFSFGKGSAKKKKDKDGSAIELLKKTVGIDDEAFKKEKKLGEIKSAVSRICGMLSDILRELIKLLKYCKIKRMKLNVCCADEDAAECALKYGECCAILYPMIGFIESSVKVKKSGRDINVFCDYSAKEDKIEYEFMIGARVFRLLVALIKIALPIIKRRTGRE